MRALGVSTVEREGGRDPGRMGTWGWVRVTGAALQRKRDPPVTEEGADAGLEKEQETVEPKNFSNACGDRRGAGPQT